MKKEPCSRNHGERILEEESWGSICGEILEEGYWKRSQGRESLGQDSSKRNQGRGILDGELRKSNPEGVIREKDREGESWQNKYVEEVTGKNPESTQETPRRHPEAARRHPGGTQEAPRATQRAQRRHPKAPRRQPGEQRGICGKMLQKP